MPFIKGQSGNPKDIHYDDLLDVWAADASVPLLFSREAIEQHLDRTIQLSPLPSTGEQ